MQLNFDNKLNYKLNYNLVPMKLTTEFSKVNAKIGETIDLKCFAEGNPKSKILWHKLNDNKCMMMNSTNKFLLVKLFIILI